MMYTKTIETIKKDIQMGIHMEKGRQFNDLCKKHTEIIKKEKHEGKKAVNSFLLSVLVAAGPEGLELYEYIVETLKDPTPGGWDVIKCYSYALDLGIIFPMTEYIGIMIARVGYDNAYLYFDALISCVRAHGIEVSEQEVLLLKEKDQKRRIKAFERVEDLFK